MSLRELTNCKKWPSLTLATHVLWVCKHFIHITDLNDVLVLELLEYRLHLEAFGCQEDLLNVTILAPSCGCDTTEVIVLLESLCHMMI